MSRIVLTEVAEETVSNEGEEERRGCLAMTRERQVRYLSARSATATAACSVNLRR
jgi:hypothetical protein